MKPPREDNEGLSTGFPGLKTRATLVKPPKIDSEGLSRLWEQFIERGDGKAREHLLIHYLPLVKLVAGRMKIGLPDTVEYDDLVSSGLMGLVGSLDNFDPKFGFKFETYAVPRIRGAILDWLRDVDWLPRSYRQKSRRLDQAMSRLIGRLGRAPNDSEVAAELGFDDEDGYQRFMEQVGAASLVSLDTPMATGEEGETGSLHEVIPDSEGVDPLTRVEEADARRAALRLIDGLNEQERAVVALYYYEELTFREIGKVLGVSESRVCQIHTRIIASLRAQLRNMME